jgi:ABC-2 type transport system permease protein
MFEFTRYYASHRIRGTVALTAGLALLTSLYVYMFPSVSAAVDLDSFAESYPPALIKAFGIESLGTIEGFLAAELYTFAFVILLGLYFAYSAASLIAADVETARTELLLTLPVTRSRFLLEKFASLLVPLLVLNIVLPVVVYAGVFAVGESISVVALLVVHLLSIPYLLTTAAIGLCASVVFDRASIAQRVAMGVVFGLFLVESVVTGTDVSWLGALSPMRYYDPTSILVATEYDVAGGVILLAGTAALVAGSIAQFERSDIS